MKKKSILLFLFSFLLLPQVLISAPKVSTALSQSIDTSGKPDTVKPNQNGLQQSLPIDTSTASVKTTETYIQADTVQKIDSVMTETEDENKLTNTRLFIYILLSVLGLVLFFFIFVINLFKTFHKKRSTRQSLLLSWNLFFIVTIIWIFIIWGIVAAFWTVPSFMIVMIFLFIISLIMTIIAVKSK
ncbi:MAG TPA: hypothetical protein PK536_06360 [Ignavibacteria bacterium]|nr:hypothetical protein [Bacteroidota bacterium]HRI85053.1 hypothetical protein [Ignavibacteria bacterium]HRJ99742.1 hypothetical protein [Ignavibacteria bacterium]